VGSPRPKIDHAERLRRLAIANQVLVICASYGRRFFSQDADKLVRMDTPRISRFEFDARRRLWYIDKWRGARIYVHHDPSYRRGWSHRFSDGGTLLYLCEMLRDYTLCRRPDIHLGLFGPWPEHICGGDLWGYGPDMEIVRREVDALVEKGKEAEGA
jgi:hypothetical protein